MHFLLALSHVHSFVPLTQFHSLRSLVPLSTSTSWGIFGGGVGVSLLLHFSCFVLGVVGSSRPRMSSRREWHCTGAGGKGMSPISRHAHTDCSSESWFFGRAPRQPAPTCRWNLDCLVLLEFEVDIDSTTEVDAAVVLDVVLVLRCLLCKIDWLFTVTSDHKNELIYEDKNISCLSRVWSPIALLCRSRNDFAAIEHRGIRVRLSRGGRSYRRRRDPLLQLEVGLLEKKWLLNIFTGLVISWRTWDGLTLICDVQPSA